MLRVGVTELRDAITILMRIRYFTEQSYLCSIICEQCIELSLVKFELLSKILLHGVILNNSMHLIGVIGGLNSFYGV